MASTAARCGESLELAVGRTGAVPRDWSRPGKRAKSWSPPKFGPALEGLGQVAGAVYTDDVLDRVFRRFCIGK